ncbi:MAG: SpoIIE family protein phosphatase [Thermoguttaceae bacterium]
MINTSIRTQLIFWIGLPLLIVYGIVTTLQTRSEMRWTIDRTQKLICEKTALNATKCDNIFSQSAEVAKSIANFAVVERPTTSKDITDFIKQSLAENPRIIGSTIAYEPGMFAEDVQRFSPYICRNPEKNNESGDGFLEKDLANEYDYFTWEWYSVPKKSQVPSWSEPYDDEGGGNVLMCTYSVPFSLDGKFAGVATVDISLDEIQQIVANIPYENAKYFLFSSKGTVISSQLDYIKVRDNIFDNPIQDQYNFDIKHLNKGTYNGDFSKTITSKGTDALVFESREDGRRAWMVSASLNNTGWSLIALIPENIVLRPVYKQLKLNLIISLLGIIAIFAIILQVSRRIISPIERLTVFAKELASGNLDAKVRDVKTTNEIGQLANTFDQMAGELKASVEKRISEETARKMVENELQVARRIQTSLLPHVFPAFPERKEFDLFALNEPAKYMAGDFYDFFLIDEKRLAIVIADVSGKGVPAAMFMAVTRTAIRNFTTLNAEPQKVITKLNDALVADNTDLMFVTLFYGHYNIETGELTYVNAGHNPPYIVRDNGNTETLEATGALVAVFPEVEFGQRKITVNINDVLVLFTDGVTEAHKEGVDLLFGEERLINVLKKSKRDDAENLCNEIVSETLEFSEGERHDDITLLVLKKRQ